MKKLVTETLGKFLAEEMNNESHRAIMVWEEAEKTGKKLKITFFNFFTNQNNEMHIKIIKKYRDDLYLVELISTNSKELNSYINDKLMILGLPTQLKDYFTITNEYRSKKLIQPRLINIELSKE
jgi:hypothetical protein